MHVAVALGTVYRGLFESCGVVAAGADTVGPGGGCGYGCDLNGGDDDGSGGGGGQESGGECASLEEYRWQ